MRDRVIGRLQLHIRALKVRGTFPDESFQFLVRAIERLTHRREVSASVLDVAHEYRRVALRAPELPPRDAPAKNAFEAPRRSAQCLDKSWPQGRVPCPAILGAKRGALHFWERDIGKNRVRP